MDRPNNPQPSSPNPTLKHVQWTPCTMQMIFTEPSWPQSQDFPNLSRIRRPYLNRDRTKGASSFWISKMISGPMEQLIKHLSEISGFTGTARSAYDHWSLPKWHVRPSPSFAYTWANQPLSTINHPPIWRMIASLAQGCQVPTTKQATKERTCSKF